VLWYSSQKHTGQILEIQDAGPFLLGGHSLGGILAVETAVMLEQMGHYVGQVGKKEKKSHASVYFAWGMVRSLKATHSPPLD
jgi:hypothetical protein